MKVFMTGISGAVGRLLARDLAERGDDVSGLVRREEQRADLSRWGVDSLVYTAGSNGGAREVTAALDGEGAMKALEAASIAGVDRRGGPRGKARRGPGEGD
ncbi:hypothetical protein [Occultella gossypii]|uniref:NAD-dependent epimerase/dehydratase family protein n=1 Tax=Occultella gossypii TaxID=2800820 RepID=A0ABS7S9Z9_9MICO|nr:hypothetical protein [Occultella gossypii]MBZ2196917.1 hypothetical protein [Occultella gossypii]